jgi:hypothetical protein
VFLTVETSRGRGAISNDFTRIYTHFDNAGQTAKQLLLDGEYVQAAKVVRLNPTEVTFCVPDSYTRQFINQVTLRAGSASETIQSRLQEHCGREVALVTEFRKLLGDKEPRAPARASC